MFNYTNWTPSYPREFNQTSPACVYVSKDQWLDAPCGISLPFVCYRDMQNPTNAIPVETKMPPQQARGKKGDAKTWDAASGRNLKPNLKAKSEPKPTKAKQPSKSDRRTPAKKFEEDPRLGNNSPRTYHKVLLEKTWSDARDYCQVHHTDLLSIRSKQENMDTSGLFDQIKLGWCGLYNEQQSPTGWQWVNGDRVGYTNWKSGNPYRYKMMNPVCVYVQDGRWSDAPCRFLFPFVCYADLSGKPKKPTPDPLLDYDGLSVIDAEEKPHLLSEKNLLDNDPLIPKTSLNEYFLIKEEMTWGEAQDQCRNRHTDMLTVQNKEENNMASKLLSLDEPAWIGLFNEHQTEYSWMWTNGESASFFNWDTYYPMDFATMSVCVIMVNGRWKDVPCDFKFSFICYSE
ncbi:secretory phospholipase A2 receptor-like [Mustelus asterias]